MSGILDWLYTDSSEVKRAEDTTNGLIAVTQEEAKRGIITPDEMQSRINQITLDGDYRYRYTNPDLNPSDQFQLGWNEGVSNVRKTATDTISAATGTALGIIPWQIWAVAGIAIVIYLAPLFFARR